MICDLQSYEQGAQYEVLILSTNSKTTPLIKLYFKPITYNNRTYFHIFPHIIPPEPREFLKLSNSFFKTHRLKTFTERFGLPFVDVRPAIHSF